MTKVYLMESKDATAKCVTAKHVPTENVDE